MRAASATGPLRFGVRPSLAAIVLAAVAAGCLDGNASESARKVSAAERTRPIVVGAPWPWEEQPNLLYSRGIELATAEVNAAGGVHGRPLEIRRVDDRQTVNDGRFVAQQLTSDKDVVAIIGHLQSYVTVPAAAIYDLAGLVVIAPTSTDPALTAQGYGRLFRTIFTDREVGRQMAGFAAAQGQRRVCIYYIRNAYGRELANAFEERAGELGVTIIDRRSYDPGGDEGERSVSEVVRDWKAREPQAVFLAAEAREAVRFTTEARRQGLDASILGGDAVGVPDLLRLGAATMEGAVLASAFHPDVPLPEVQRFVTSFRERYGQRPDVTAALGYDAVHVLAAGMIRARSVSPDSVAAALRSMPAMAGVTGRFQFSAQGELLTPHVVKLRVHNGRFEYLE